MNRISENIVQRSTTTKSLMNPSSPGHRRNSQLWHGIKRSEGMQVGTGTKQRAARSSLQKDWNTHTKTTTRAKNKKRKQSSEKLQSFAKGKQASDCGLWSNYTVFVIAVPNCPWKSADSASASASDRELERERQRRKNESVEMWIIYWLGVWVYSWRRSC